MSNTVTQSDRQTWTARRKKILSKLIQFCQVNSYPIIHKHDISHIPSQVKKVVYLRIGDLIEEYVNWVDFNDVCQKKQKIIFVITDNFYQYKDLSNIKFFAFTELNGVFVADEEWNINPVKEKLYNCFINRVESVRQSWFYFLHHYNLLDRGYVSLLMNNLDSYSKYQGRELFDHIHSNYGLDQLPHFEKAYQELKHKVPYQNFKEVNDLRPYIANSKYSLTLETCASHETNDKWHFSEKSMRVLQHPTIPILFVQNKGIELLKNLGFELYVDHSDIDNLPWQQRQQELLNILINDPFDFNKDKAIEICLHNRQILHNMLSLAIKENYFDKFFDVINES